MSTDDIPEHLIDDALAWALIHFEAQDRANAAIHCSPVRYSPITFRLAEALGKEYSLAAAVLAERGKYVEDRGR